MSLLVASCGQNDPARQGIEPRSEVAAPVQVGESFVIHQDKSGRKLLAIKKASLEKEFLLQAMLMKQNVAPLGTALKSRVVAFVLRDGKLLLVEATQGHTVTTEFPQTLLLAQFPIVDDSGDSILFDFNTGMAHLYSAGEWRGSDGSGESYKVEAKANRLNLSYLSSIELNAKNQLTINQIAQLTTDYDGKEEFLPIEARYYLSPYHPNKAFTPVQSPGFERVGFFEVAPQLFTTGKSVVRATKFDTAKPIVFALSSNTPADYKQAVKEGVLYWNRFLKGAPLQVVDAPASVRAPNIDYNVVQWVSWNTAGYAYADDQADPRSGEILHAQVFIPSVFAYPRKEMAKSLIEKMRMPALSGFSHESLCQFDPTHLQPAGETALIVSQADRSKMLKASQDVIRYVVAHEIGHALGLRHNFSGSLGATPEYSLAKRKDLLAAYLKDGKTPAKVLPSSSVMDYLPFEEAVLLGNAMADAAVKPDYDFKAMTTLYEGKHYAAKDVPVYCPDTKMNTFIDCQPFDAGHSAVEYAGWATSNAASNFPYTLMSKFEAVKREATGNALEKLQAIAFDPSKMASSIFSGTQDLISHWEKPAKFVKVHRAFPVVSPLNQEEVDESELVYLDAEVTRLGGADKLFPMVSAKDLEAMQKQFVTALANRRDGDDLTFDADEAHGIVETAALVFERLETEIPKADIKMLSKIPMMWKLPFTPIGQGVMNVIAKRVEEYTFAVTGQTIDAKLTMSNVDKKKDDDPATIDIEVKLPVFAYPSAARGTAYALLASTGPLNAAWSTTQKKGYADRLNKMVSAALKDYPTDKGRLIKVTPPEKRQAVSQWFIENGSLAVQLAK